MKTNGNSYTWVDPITGYEHDNTMHTQLENTLEFQN